MVGGDAEAGWGMLAAAMTQIPAVVVIGGVAVAAFAFVPRWAPAVSWAALALCLTCRSLPQAAIDASPFTHLPQVPAEDQVRRVIFWAWNV